MVVKHLVNCINPSWVYNKYTHERIFVDCGKCDACLNRRHERYVQAMLKEQKQHKFAFFCTLNYSDKYIPKLYRSNDGKTLFDPDPDYGFTMEVDTSNLCHRDMSFYRQKKYFEYARFSDFQRFIKRFRINSQRFLNNKDEKIRYYGASEYGPFTIRPHFHCILFFDSDRLAENFGEIFYKSWSVYNRRTKKFDCIGKKSQFRPLSQSDSAERYTAAYCDCNTDVPSLYKSSEIKPRHSYSKFPTLGCAPLSEDEIWQTFHTGALRRYLGVDINSEPVIDYIPRSVKSRYFPKCVRFSRLSDRHRVVLYGLYQKVLEINGGICTYKDFASTFQEKFDYFCRLYPSLVDIFVNQSNCKRPYYSLYFASKRFYENSVYFRSINLPIMSPLEMVHRIDEFYKLSEYYHFRDYMEFLEEFSKKEDVRYYYSSCLSSVSKATLDFYSSLDYKSLKEESSRIQKDGKKSKKERDYQLKGNAVEYIPDDTHVSPDLLREFFLSPNIF